jgi:hypothetical protein
MNERPQNFMLHLRDALTASWDKRTAYLEVEETGNPARGQCYPTSRTVQHYYPKVEIIKGKVWTGETVEVHFWNGMRIDNEWYHIDLTWQQFPRGSVIQEFSVIERHELNDSEATKIRCALLLERVDNYIKSWLAAGIRCFQRRLALPVQRRLGAAVAHFLWLGVFPDAAEGHVVLVILADARQVLAHLDAMASQFAFRPDP